MDGQWAVVGASASELKGAPTDAQQLFGVSNPRVLGVLGATMNKKTQESGKYGQALSRDPDPDTFAP
jgi:hypothetical protein